MALQDRNAHKDAAFIRKLFQGTLATIVTVDKDEVHAAIQLRHNFRLTDAFFSCRAVGVAAAELRACIAKELSAIGAPQFGQAAAVTFSIEAFDQLDAAVFTAVAATAAQAFSGTEVISDGFWGVFTVQIDGTQTITTKAGAATMAYLTEADAIKNAPAPDAGNGLVGLLTIEMSGGDFTAGTTNTNSGNINSFNTIDRGGHPITAAILATQSSLRATRAERLLVAGVGNLIGEADDHVVITARSTGLATFEEGVVSAEYRKTPAQGEGVEASTGLSRPFVP